MFFEADKILGCMMLSKKFWHALSACCSTYKSYFDLSVLILRIFLSFIGHMCKEVGKNAHTLANIRPEILITYKDQNLSKNEGGLHTKD